MIKKKYIIFFITTFLMFFCTSCSKTEQNTTENISVSESPEAGEQESVDEKNTTIQQPVVSLKNEKKGVLVSWNEIPNVDGYYVYSKRKGENFKRIATIEDSKTIEYLDLKAPAGTTYYYTIRAFCGEEKSEYKGVEIKTGIWEPEVKATYTDSKVKVSWNQISDCEGYIVYRKTEGEEYGRISVIEDFKTTSYVDEDVTVGNIYTYTVRAYIGDEKSTYSGVNCATIGQPIVEVENVGEGVEICWNEIEGAEGYYVYRKIEGGEYERLHEINDPTVTTFTDTTFVVGAKYGYTVRAYLGNEKSAYAYEKLQTDLGRVTVSLRTSDEGIQLEWNEITLAEGYYIYRRIGDDGDYELIDTIKEQSVTNYSDQQVESGKSYYYSVRAFLGDEESSYSGAIITAK